MHLDLLALEVNFAVPERLLEYRRILAQMLQRLAERQPVRPFDHRAMAGPDAQLKAAGRDLADRDGLLDHRDGVARVGHHDRGPELDLLGLRAGDGQRRQAVRAESAGGKPDRWHARLVGPPDQRHRLGQRESLVVNARYSLGHARTPARDNPAPRPPRQAFPARRASWRPTAPTGLPQLRARGPDQFCHTSGATL